MLQVNWQVQSVLHNEAERDGLLVNGWFDSVGLASTHSISAAGYLLEEAVSKLMLRRLV
jgi:hypothetical protein